MNYYQSQYWFSGKKNPTKYQGHYTPKYYRPAFAKYRLPTNPNAKVSKGKVIVKSRIPAELKRKIEVYARSKEELHRLAHLVVVLFRKFMQKDVKVTELCRNYILMILNGNKDYYWLFTKIIVQRMKMVEVIVNKNGTKFSTKNKACKRYKLNEKYRGRDDFEPIFYEQRKPRKRKLKKHVESLSPALQGVFGTMGQLRLTDNLENIEKELKGSVDNLREKVCDRTIEMKNGNIRYIRGNERTIYKKGKFDSLDHFVESKSDELLDRRLNAVSKISQIQKLPIFPSRDTTSHRVHHVLTNIASDVLPYIMIEDDKIQEIDLMNSQLALFCNIIYRSISSNNTIHLPKVIKYLFTQSLGGDWQDDTTIKHHRKRWNRHTVYLCSDLALDPNSITLIKSAFSGTFYECVGQMINQVDHLSDSQRKEVKLTMFNLLFGSVIHSETLQNSIRFRKVFPAFYFLIFYLKMLFGFLYESKDPILKIINLDIDLLKRDKPKITGMKAGSNLLSILLQRIESTIFIDRILVTLYEMGYQVLPKHDSIICKSSDYEEVNSIIQSELNRILGEGMYRLR